MRKIIYILFLLSIYTWAFSSMQFENSFVITAKLRPGVYEIFDIKSNPKVKIKPGNQYFIVTTNNQVLSCKILKYNFIKRTGKLRIMTPFQGELLLGEKVVQKSDILNYSLNQLQLKKFWEDTESQEWNADQIQEQISKAGRFQALGHFWDAIRLLIQIYKSTDEKKVQSDCLYYIARNFTDEYTGMNSIFGRKNSSLKDYFSGRNILFSVMNMRLSNDTYQRASYYIGEAYLNASYKIKNSTSYQYFKQSGKYGQILLDYGRSLLKDLAPESILLTEGGDNQVFSIQMLQQLEGYRCDVQVYDQNYNLFNQIYGNNRTMNPAQLIKTKKDALEYLLQYQKIPQIYQYYDPIKHDISRKSENIYFTWNYSLDDINAIRINKGQNKKYLVDIGPVYEVMDQSMSNTHVIYRPDFLSKYSGKEIQAFPFLDREIYINSYYKLGQALLKQSQIETNKEKSRDMIEEVRKIAEILYSIGYDTLGALHNTSLLLLSISKNSFPDSVELQLTQAIEQFPQSWSTYQLFFNMLVRKMILEPDRAEISLSKYDSLISKLKSEMSLQLRGGNYESHPEWVWFKRNDDFVQNMRTYPQRKLINDLMSIEKDINAAKNPLDLARIQEILKEFALRATIVDYEPYYHKVQYLVWRLYQYLDHDYYHLKLIFKISILTQTWDIARETGEQLVQSGELETDEKGTFYFVLGEIYSRYHAYKPAMHYFQKYMNECAEIGTGISGYRFETDNLTTQVRKEIKKITLAMQNEEYELPTIDYGIYRSIKLP